MTRILLATALLAFVLPGAAQAASAPPQLRGKSIIVTWSETRVQRPVGEPDFRTVSVGHQFRVYIGATGRVFSRFVATVGRRTGSRDETGDTANSRAVPSFSAQSMTVFIGGRAGGGVRRLAVSFDAGFSGCTAQVSRGTEVGRQTSMAKSLINGRRIEIKSTTVSGASCSMQTGNIFGNE